MQKIYAVIRTVGEKTTINCRKAVGDRFGLDYKILWDFRPLEKVAKETIRTGAERVKEFDWIMAVDADIVLTKPRWFYEEYCQNMRDEFEDRLFSFTAYLDCTKRGLIGGMHFFRTRYCQRVFDRIKDVSFQYKPGREESEICWWVRDKMAIGTVQGSVVTPFGIHIFEK